MTTTEDLTDDQFAERRATYFTGLLWHLGVFFIVNTFFWLLDVLVGQEGLQWAPWITIFWGLGLSFHVLAWLIDGRQIEQRRAERYRREQMVDE